MPIKQPLFELLKKVKTARAIYTTAIRAIEDQEEINERKAYTRDLTNELITRLKALNNNYSKTESNCITSRKRRAGGSNTTSSNPIVIAELQSIRRSILALIEVSKAVSTLQLCFLGELPTNYIRSSYATALSLRRTLALSIRPLGLIPLRRRRGIRRRIRRQQRIGIRISSVEYLLCIRRPYALQDTLALLYRGATPKMIICYALA